MLERERDPTPEYSTRRIINNHSTGQLIPTSRAEALRAKRDVLKRKINQVADELFKLKYDTEYQCQELEKLSQTVQNICSMVQNSREQVKKEIEDTVKPAFKEIASFHPDLNENPESNRKKHCDNSTQLSAITERSQPIIQEKETTISMLQFKEGISDEDKDRGKIINTSQKEVCISKKNNQRMYHSLKIVPRRERECASEKQIPKKDSPTNKKMNNKNVVNTFILFAGLLTILILLL